MTLLMLVILSLTYIVISIYPILYQSEKWGQKRTLFAHIFLISQDRESCLVSKMFWHKNPLKCGMDLVRELKNGKNVN